MDRRLKERLVGATILVVLVVLIVPELLSGPHRPSLRSAPNSSSTETVRNVTVDLATSKAMPSDTVAGGAASAATMPANADEAVHEAPAPASSAADDRTPIHRAAVPPTITTLQAQQPATTAPIETSASSPKSSSAALRPTAERSESAQGSHHNWAVQLGSFASRGNAENLDRQLKAKGLPAYLFANGRGRELRYKVRIGPLVDRGAADKMVSRLRKEGHSASVIVP